MTAVYTISPIEQDTTAYFYSAFTGLASYAAPPQEHEAEPETAAAGKQPELLVLRTAGRFALVLHRRKDAPLARYLMKRTPLEPLAEASGMTAEAIKRRAAALANGALLKLTGEPPSNH